MNAQSSERQARALQLFEQCLDQPESQRTAWLAEQVGDDAELAAVVARLLDADRRSGDFLEAAAIPAPSLSGQQVGAFVLDEELGVGGMGRVYRAHRADARFAQDVAIKLFDGSPRDALALARFDAERRILARLEHPGIARLIDGGSRADGTPWVAMELVHGEPINRYCESARLGVADRVALFIKVCEALEAAHQHGIVHRDIKPGNVLVDEHGQPRLIDFGIAKVLDTRQFDAELPATATMATPLTPEYASPEQVRGQPVAASSDVYSLGVLLYQLLTGTRPYQLTTSNPLELAETICLTLPPNPSDRVRQSALSAVPGLPDARQLRRRLRGDLDRIVMTAMRKEPQQRYASAAALGRDLERHLTGLPVQARGASRGYRLLRFVQRHRAASVAVAAIILTLSAALLAVSLQMQKTRREAARAEASRDFLSSMILRVDPFEKAPEPTLAGALRAAVPEIDSRFAEQPELAADMRYAIGYAFQNLGETQQSRALIEQALAWRRQHGSALEQAEALDGLAMVDWWDSDLARAEAHEHEALALLATNTNPRAGHQRVEILTNLGAILIDAGDYPRSVAFSQQAAAEAERVGGIDLSTLASIQGNLGNALVEVDGQAEAGLAALRKAKDLQGQATGVMHPSYAIVLNNLALSLNALGHRDEAIAALQQSVAIRRKTLGDDHPQTATALGNLSALLVLAGRTTEAEPLALEALKVAEAGYPAGHPRIGKAHQALARLYAATDRPNLARQHAQAALAMYRAAESVDPAWIESVQAMLKTLPTAPAAPAAKGEHSR